MRCTDIPRLNGIESDSEDYDALLEKECGPTPEDVFNYHSDRFNEYIGSDLEAVMYYSDEVFDPEKYF